MRLYGLTQDDGLAFDFEQRGLGLEPRQLGSDSTVLDSALAGLVGLH